MTPHQGLQTLDEATIRTVILCLSGQLHKQNKSLTKSWFAILSELCCLKYLATKGKAVCVDVWYDQSVYSAIALNLLLVSSSFLTASDVQSILCHSFSCNLKTPITSSTLQGVDPLSVILSCLLSTQHPIQFARHSWHAAQEEHPVWKAPVPGRQQAVWVGYVTCLPLFFLDFSCEVQTLGWSEQLQSRKRLIYAQHLSRY